MSLDNLEQTRQMVFLVLGVVLAVNLILALVWAFRRLGGRPSFAPRWSLADVWIGAQIALLLTLLLAGLLLAAFALVGLAVPGARLPQDDVGLLLFLGLPATIAQNVAFFVVPAGFIAGKYGLRLRDIGLPSAPRPRDWWAGILLGVAAFLVAGALETGLHALAEQFRHVRWVAAALRFEQTNPVAQIIRALPRHGPGMLLLAIATIGVSAPLGEEMLFRGFLFNALKQRLGKFRFGLAAAVVISGLVFASVHSYALGLLPVFLIGVLLAWVYHTSGSLWTSILLHATNNTLAVVIAILFPQSGG